MWTPTALASEARPWRGDAWRVVEAQHRISTNRLADGLADQARLEMLADAVKPDLPPETRGLHYLLASPFRYGHRNESRFRRANERPGIFYAAEREATAIAETAYWRLRFFQRSPGFVPPSTTSEHTSFTAALATASALDLTLPPFDNEAARWIDPLDYTACQDLAAQAREARIALIRTRSARDPGGGCNLVLFDPAAFARQQPVIRRTWHLRHEGGRLLALAAFPAEERFVFTAAQFGLG
ncbi:MULTISPECIES: RES family NAD+ phosphorylase [unclassified Novosphingobium]|uniref:RES family NAD+ phosphorylase n=1 Tax=unclassified Novosphingobium TaxID=2644732 RepID=UPI000F7E5E58|nr:MULTISPECIES: RES family NAD+ phosphorylase [unclassified Novosphingobium]QCI95864.1 RES domain-containing protein [Novosphingobium sp. EMRT-2]